MKEGQTYPINTALAILVIGEPGASKTNTAFEFPDPWFLDADKNLRNAIERHPGKTFYYDDPEVDENGKKLEEHEIWPNCLRLLEAAAKDDRVGTLVADGMSRMSDYLKAFLVKKGGEMERPLKVGGETVMTKSLWEPFATLWKRYIFTARASGKPFILTAHLKVDENELTKVQEQRVNLQGQLAADLAGRFTDCWLAVAEPTTDTKRHPSGVRYYIRTAPTNRARIIKCSCGLPTEVDVLADGAFRALIDTVAKGGTVKSEEA